MPTKTARQRSDPMVPIVGERVAAALRWAKKSYADVCNAAEQNAAARGVTRQAIGLIANGTTKRCHQSLRRVIARLCGPPITEEYLGGEKELQIPLLEFPPSGLWGSGYKLPVDSNGRRTGGIDGPLPPRYVLEAFALGQEVAQRTASEPIPFWSVGHEHPPPKIENALRWMLSLTFWRELIHTGQSIGDVGDAFAASADEFAYHVASALRILFRPWFEGREELRPLVLRRLMHLLDGVWSENMEMYRALERGDIVDVTILNEIQRQPCSQRSEYRKQLESFRDEERRKGTPELEIWAKIRDGQEAEDFS